MKGGTQNSAGTILVTGGAGYIGSHACVALLEAGYAVVVVDNLVNSRIATIENIATVAGRAPRFYRVDVRDAAALGRVFARHAIDAVIHFAGAKAVAESVAQPLDYYDVNVNGSVVLLQAMRAAGVQRIVFSSSATVYGEPDTVPMLETHALRPENPYGRTKLAVERILRDLYDSEPGWAVAALRYFNPAGAHSSGLLGEDPNGTPNNLLPCVGQVLSGRRDVLNVYGTDYDTPDGTAVRDYVHVVDLARAHVLAVAALSRQPGHHVANVGTGRGRSVLEVIAAYEAASGRRVNRLEAPRRAGDIASYYADPGLAQRWLGWRAEHDLARMCADAWRFQRRADAVRPGALPKAASAAMQEGAALRAAR